VRFLFLAIFQEFAASCTKVMFSTLISLIQIGRMAESDKDLEIMVLRYQLGIAER
jgi:hypothetical protein